MTCSIFWLMCRQCFETGPAIVKNLTEYINENMIFKADYRDWKSCGGESWVRAEGQTFTLPQIKAFMASGWWVGLGWAGIAQSRRQHPYWWPPHCRQHLCCLHYQQHLHLQNLLLPQERYANSVLSYHQVYREAWLQSSSKDKRVGCA